MKLASPPSGFIPFLLICLSFSSPWVGFANDPSVSGSNVVNRPEIARPDSVPDEKQRIALLIRDLEEINAHPLMSPGYINFADDPVVLALVAQGEDAVEPLLNALASDTRPTRTVDDGGGKPWLHGKQRVVRVEEPIVAALAGILLSRDQFPSLDEAYVNCSPMGPRLKPKELAEFIRTYREKYRGKPLAERWYGLLADDTADPRVWAEAASDLTLREAETIPVYGTFITAPRLKPGEPDPMRGEVLRNNTNPTISELMAKRLRESWADLKDAHWYSMAPVQTLAASLEKWDGGNQIETLRWYCSELEKTASKQEPDRDSSPIRELIRTYIARKEAGDGRAMADYAKWLRGANAAGMSKMTRLYFLAPLWLYRHDPAIADLTKWLFTNPASPWMPDAPGVNPAWISQAASTPLVAVPEFRTLLLEQLKNPLVVGCAETTPKGHVASFPM